MSVGKFTEFFRGIKESFSQAGVESKEKAAANKIDTATSKVSRSVLKNAGKPSGTAQTRKSSFLKIDSSAVKARVATLKSLVLAKFQSMPKKEVAPKHTGVPQEVHDHLENEGALQRTALLKQFKSILQPIADFNNRGPALDAAVRFLASVPSQDLTQSLYNGVARQLQASLANPRQSISLEDDSDMPPVHNGVTRELLNVPTLQGELRAKVEQFNFVNDIQNLKTKVNAGRVDRAIAEHIIDQVADAFPKHTEVNITFGQTTFTAILIVDDKNNPEILVKGEKLGEGAAAVAYKAESLTSSNAVVVKYATSLAEESDEEEKALELLKDAGGDEGVQKQMKLTTAEGVDGAKKVVVSPFYKNCDYTKALVAEQFLTEVLDIPQSQVHLAGDAIEGELKATAAQRWAAKSESLIEFFTSDAPKEAKLAELGRFTNQYTGVLTALLDSSDQVKQLFATYRELIENS